MIFRRHKDLKDVCESSRAVERAEEARDTAEGKWPRVRDVAAALQVLREQNHFIEGFKSTFKEKS